MNEEKICNDLLKSRTLYLCGIIDQKMASQFGETMTWLHHKSPEGSLDSNITVYINSNGGAVDAALCIYDMIYCSSVPVTGIVSGRACSSAAIILQACHDRAALHDAEILFHPIRFDVRLHVLAPDMEWYRIAQEHDNSTRRIVAVRSGKSIEDAWEFIKEEKLMGAEEARELGFIDRVVYGSRAGYQPGDGA